MQKHDGRKRNKEAQKEIRLLAIEHWKKTGNMAEVARVFNVSYAAIRKWVDKIQSSGEETLHVDERGRPVGKELSPQQEKKIIWKITNKQPEQLELAFGLWTRENVRQLILQHFGIRRSVRQVGRYLKEWGFTPQKPVYKAYEQKSKEVKNWLENEYPLIQSEAKKLGAMVLWGDETGIRSHDQRGRSFAPKGRTPIVLKTAKHFSVNMISAVNNRGKLHFMIFKGGINGEKFINFLKRLIRVKAEYIFLIVDNLAVHKTKKVKSWEEEHNKKLKLFYLPAYSPELNPDEYLNQDLKANIVDKVKMHSAEDLEKCAKMFLEKRKRKPTQVVKYFHHDKVKYAA